MFFKHILSIYGSFKHMSEMLKSETTHNQVEEEKEEITNSSMQGHMGKMSRNVFLIKSIVTKSFSRYIFDALKLGISVF